MKGALDTGTLRPNQGRTNQKLYFAKLQLDRIAVLLAEQSGFAWEAEALAQRESAVAHLYGAYLCFLQELLRFYRLSAPVFANDAAGLRVLSTETVRIAMHAKGQVSPEISVLQSLEGQRDSWLARLLSQYQQLAVAEEASAESAVNAPHESALGKSISLVGITHDAPLSTADLQRIQNWHHDLTLIIRGFRAEMAEW